MIPEPRKENASVSRSGVIRLLSGHAMTGYMAENFSPATVCHFYRYYLSSALRGATSQIF